MPIPPVIIQASYTPAITLTACSGPFGIFWEIKGPSHQGHIVVETWDHDVEMPPRGNALAHLNRFMNLHREDFGHGEAWTMVPFDYQDSAFVAVRTDDDFGSVLGL